VCATYFTNTSLPTFNGCLPNQLLIFSCILPSIDTISYILL
jgi:hypothetical protein